MARPLSLLIKPASGCCNLRCSYCFYRDYPESVPRMAPETVDLLIEKAFAYASGPVSFAFQGGEPTLCGTEFFANFFAKVQAENRNRLPVSYALQTNGMRINEEFAKLFRENNVLVGLSWDGPEDLHDLHRMGANGAPSSNAVRSAAALLREYKVPLNILTVITEALCGRADEVYGFFKGQGFSYLQFIPCLPPYGQTPAQFAPSPSPAALGMFLSRLAALWHADWKANRYVSIRYFDNLAGMLLGRPAELCSLAGICTNQLVFEADGSCYPCDFYVTKAWRMGNIHTADFETLLQNSTASKFTAFRPPPASCRSCAYVSLCRGGCKRERDSSGKTFFCQGYKAFFEASLPLLADVAQDVRTGKTPPPPKF